MPTVPVTRRALIARINRKLARDSQKLCASHSAGELSNLGPYYIVDTYYGNIQTSVAWPVDLEKYGRELGVLAQWEILNDKVA